jgi:DNA-binding transcriptional MerR regulator
VADYRIEELAAAAGATVRTVQSYRNRHLLPPPRRQGRIALFSDEHLARLRLIADLIDRGYSLNAIGELLSGLHQGHDISDLLGVEAAAAPPVAAEPTPLRRADLDAMFGHQATATIRISEQLGVLARVAGTGSGDPEDPDASEYVLTNPALFQAGVDLVAAGIPIDAVLDEGLAVWEDVDRIASRFVQLVVDHVVDGPGGAVDGVPLSEIVRRVRPLAEVVVAAQLGPAIERHTHLALEAHLERLLGENGAASEAS